MNTTIRKRILLLLFSLIIILPCVVVIWGGYFYYSYGIAPLLTNQIKQSINETVEVAEAYLEEHTDNMKYDILSMANEIQVDHNFFVLIQQPELFDKLINTQASQRALSEVMIFNKRQVVAKSRGAISGFYRSFSWSDVKRADLGGVVIIKQPDEDRVRAILKLDKFMEDTYLLIGRSIDPKLSEYITKTKGSANQYNMKLDYLNEIKFKLFIILFATFLFMIAVTIFFGYKLARIISNPIHNLISATNTIKKGDYSVRIDEQNLNNELKMLVQAFNQMTSKIEEQRNDLVKTNDLITEKANFIENVLSKIASGVISLDENHHVTLANDYALNILAPRTKQIIGKSYLKIIPEISALLKEVESTKRIVSDTLTVPTKSKVLNLSVAIVPLYVKGRDKPHSYIITFDDMTDHMTAQKLQAWSDVARRIAHEIKNPLTPINLSAQRLEGKFADQISDNKPQFNKYINTIKNHVDDIGRIVEDFVSYAKLPVPKPESVDVIELLQSNVYTNSLMTAGSEGVKFTMHYNKKQKQLAMCDKNLISQVITNLLKNAIESIEAKHSNLSKGKVAISIKQGEASLEIEFKDNGLGFPKDKINEITEPYVTTKAEGTGIGLAIVKKIIEEHNGSLEIKNDHDGAIVKIILPKG